MESDTIFFLFFLSARQLRKSEGLKVTIWLERPLSLRKRNRMENTINHQISWQMSLDRSIIFTTVVNIFLVIRSQSKSSQSALLLNMLYMLSTNEIAVLSDPRCNNYNDNID